MTMQGTVTAAGAVHLDLGFIDAADVAHPITMMVDTGFDKYVSLPRAVIDQLQLPEFADVDVIIADGTIETRLAYMGSVIWHGLPRPVLVVELETSPLLGMLQLSGSRLTIDAVPSGDVTIEELP